ncbi:hypothetical protein AB4089_19075 [Arthrobacter sp. 2MCAF15]|uniref:hypothetical protein n=1 Tax=Arthrobacter sp. 2MCAF15 TaxID=3232984 RepID=UPI003F927D61
MPPQTGAAGRCRQTNPRIHPLSAAAAGTLAGCISTEQYMWGLRKVLDGIIAGLSSEENTLTAFAG